MIDYSTWTELQIQQAVLRATNGQCLHPVRFLGHDVSDIPLSAYNPCERAADAWPIIIKNEIGVIPPYNYKDDFEDSEPENINGEWVAVKQLYWVENDVINSEIASQHTNPLRAAMIVFLMMQGQNSCN